MRADERAACLAAIERIASASRSRVGSARSEKLVGACNEIGRVVRRRSEETAARQRPRIRELMLSTSLDPLLMTWEPLGALDRANDEPTWTRWISALFADKNAGPPAWKAFCEVVAAAEPHQLDAYDQRGRPLATANDWMKAATCCPAAFTEDLTGDGGFVDLRVEVEGLSVVIENKLWEGWHDRPKKPQHLTCSDWAQENAKRDDRVGLVFLSVYEANEERRPGWIFVTWRELAQAFRRTLKRADRIEARSAERPLLAPMAYSVASIERHLLGLGPGAAIDGPASGVEIRDLMRLAKILRYLEESDEG